MTTASTTIATDESQQFWGRSLASHKTSDTHMSKDVHGTLEKLGELIKSIRVTMMYTWSGENYRGPGIAGGAMLGAPLHSTTQLPLRARPMYTQRLDPAAYDGTLWFFADASSTLVRELQANDQVMLAYSSPDKNIFASVIGRAFCEHDAKKAEELWNIHAKGWWPAGPESNNLTLIRVQIERAEYWDGPSNTSYMLHLLKAVATGNRVDVSAEHGIVSA